MIDDVTPAAFEFRPATAQRPATVRASGDIDLANADEFEGALSQALVASGGTAADLTVDMTGVTYCDSAAIRALFTAAKQTRLTVEVISAGPVTTLLTVAGLDQIATVVARELLGLLFHERTVVLAPVFVSSARRSLGAVGRLFSSLRPRLAGSGGS